MKINYKGKKVDLGQEHFRNFYQNLFIKFENVEGVKLLYDPEECLYCLIEDKDPKNGLPLYRDKHKSIKEMLNYCTNLEKLLNEHSIA